MHYGKPCPNSGYFAQNRNIELIFQEVEVPLCTKLTWYRDVVAPILYTYCVIEHAIVTIEGSNHTHTTFCVWNFLHTQEAIGSQQSPSTDGKKNKSTFWIDSFALIWTLVFLNWFVWICWPGWPVGPPWWMPWCFREWRGLPWHDLPADHLGEVRRILFLPSPLDESIMRLLYWLHDLSGDHHSKRPPRTLFQDSKCIM